MHSNGYIHHDIKCQNILVDRITGNLKIGDLISVEKMTEKGYFSKYMGTEEFMAPESRLRLVSRKNSSSHSEFEFFNTP